MAKTGKNLVIVESPAKAKTINKYLGDDYIVKASMGHVRDLPKSGNAIDMKTFEPKYEIIKERGKGAVVTELKKLAKEAPEVYLATDLDREGEAIAWHLKEALGLKDDVQRVIFNAITKDEIRKAFEKPNRLNMDRVNAQQARRVLDRIVGYEISPVLWKKVARGLSAGRVQSVAVRLIVEREKEIEAFMPDEYWRMGAIFTAALYAAPKLAAEWREYNLPTEEGDRLKNEKDRWLADHGCFTAELAEVGGEKFEPQNKDRAREVAEALGFVIKQEHTLEVPDAKGPQKSQTRFEGSLASSPAAFKVKGIENKRSTARPPAPFITSTLQQAASTRLYFGAKRTMQVAQMLYEQGYITYMRTDSTHLSGDAINMARSFVKKEFGDRYVPEKPNFFSSSNKNAQEAHEAIRPTDCNFTPRDAEAKLKDDEAKLYRLIYNRFVACQMPPAEFDQTSILIAAETKIGEAVFRASGRKLVFDGFMKIAGISSEDQLLPDLAQGSPVAPVDLQPTQHFTQPPPRFNEASLVKELESRGIGRPSTYASIISTIQDRKYVTSVERRLHPTMLGRVVTEKLIQAFPQILDIGFTADMENKLDDVEDHKVDWIELLRNFYGPFHEAVDSAPGKLEHAGGAASPYFDEKTGTPLVYRISAGGFFLASSDPNIKITQPVDDFGKPMIREESPYKCPICGRGMMKRQGRFGDYLSCTGYSIKDAEGKPSCSMIVPLAKTGELQPPKVEPITTEILCDKNQAPMLLRNSKRGPFLGCSSFPKCRGTKMASKLTDEQATYIETLLPELRTRVEKSYNQAALMTGKPAESFGKLPELTLNRAAPAAKKPVRRKAAAK